MSRITLNVSALMQALASTWRTVFFMKARPMQAQLQRCLVLAGFVICTQVLAQPEIGSPAPDFLGRTTDGAEFKLSDHKGKVVVASFWASWCGPCRRELPLLEGMQKVLGTEKVKVVAISIENGDMFRQIRKSAHNMSLQFVHDASGSVSRAYGREGVPHLVLIGKDGQLLKRFVGYSEQQADNIALQVQAAIQAQ